MAQKELSVIPYDAIIKLEISGGFYARLQQLFMDSIATKSKEQLQELIENLKKGDENKDPFAYHFETLFIMLRSIEQEAEKQGVTNRQEVDIPEAPDQNQE